MTVITEYEYVSIVRCRTWCIWPEFSRVSSDAFCVPLPSSGDRIRLSIHLVSYEGRPRPEIGTAQPSERDTGPLVWRGQMETGYWVGQFLLKAPEDTIKVEFEHHRPLQGEVDIQVHIAAESEAPMATLKDIASSISYSTLSYLNIALGDLLIPVAPIQVRELDQDSSQFENQVSVLVRERRHLTTEVLEAALGEFAQRRLQMLEESRVALDAAMRRYLTSLTEVDPVDRYCDLWESCEFVTLDITAKGGKVGRIAQALTQHMQRAGVRRKKAQVENSLQIRTLYGVRGSLVHNAVENPTRLEEYTALLSEIALELIRFRLGLPYQRSATIEKAFDASK